METKNASTPPTTITIIQTEYPSLEKNLENALLGLFFWGGEEGIFVVFF